MWISRLGPSESAESASAPKENCAYPTGLGNHRRIRREVLGGLEQTASIARWLLASKRWDLLLIVLGGVHRASHYLWDLSQIDESGLDSKTRATLEGARRTRSSGPTARS